MLRVTLKSVLARKVRLLLSGLAFVIGVMSVSGALILIGTLSDTFDTLFTTVNQDLDVQASKTRPDNSGPPPYAARRGGPRLATENSLVWEERPESSAPPARVLPRQAKDQLTHLRGYRRAPQGLPPEGPFVSDQSPVPAKDRRAPDEEAAQRLRGSRRDAAADKARSARRTFGRPAFREGTFRW
jgi:hypothetical protein